jgi:hypothetical protein
MIEIEVPKSVMIWVMPAFDISIAALFLYMAVSLTRDFGFGNKRQLLLLFHRVLMLAGSCAFAYHALDIWNDPLRHGLTLSNFQLHLILVLITIVSALRLRNAEHSLYGTPNGGAFSGPFGRQRETDTNRVQRSI